jgi:hypothetical protein
MRSAESTALGLSNGLLPIDADLTTKKYGAR